MHIYFTVIWTAFLVLPILGAGLPGRRKSTGLQTRRMDLPIPRHDGMGRASMDTNEWRPAKPPVRPMTPFDPRKTWQTFLRHTERTEARQRKTRKRLKSASGRYLPGPPGPAGPSGPRGPRGPSGANVTKEQMFEEFRDLVREAAERRTQLAIDPQCTTSCEPILDVNDTVSTKTSSIGGKSVMAPLFDVDPTAIYPRIAVAFVWRITEDLRIDRKAFTELTTFKQPFIGGAFQRGENTDSEDGRFRVKKNGFYVFHVHLHVQPRSFALRNKFTQNPNDNVTVLVCIDSMCQKNLALETTSKMDVSSRKFTIALNGILFLEEGQYISVFVDNNSKFAIKVLSGSQMSAYLAGI